MRPYSYVRVEDHAEAMRAAAVSGAEQPTLASAQYLAGGTTIVDLMKLDVMRPSRLVDINALQKELGAIEVTRDGVRLGALVRMSAAAEHPVILRDYPVIAQTLRFAASPQIRNMATLGGNVLQRTRCSYFRDTSFTACNKRNPGSGCAALSGSNRKLAILGVSDQCIAHYPGDFAQALAALGATVEITGANGLRRLPFVDLHRLPADTPHLETALAPGDLITAFLVPAGPWTRRSLYLKVRDREAYEFALASAAVALDLQGDIVREARIALGGLATKPWRASPAEAALKGKPVTNATAKAAAEVAFAQAQTHGENAFKPDLGRRTLERALLRAAQMEM
jgi:xanthine dehydrogenase YagS FAD-binding subunit